MEREQHVEQDRPEFTGACATQTLYNPEQRPKAKSEIRRGKVITTISHGRCEDYVLKSPVLTTEEVFKNMYR